MVAMKSSLDWVWYGVKSMLPSIVLSLVCIGICNADKIEDAMDRAGDALRDMVVPDDIAKAGTLGAWTGTAGAGGEASGGTALVMGGAADANPGGGGAISLSMTGGAEPGWVKPTGWVNLQVAHNMADVHATDRGRAEFTRVIISNRIRLERSGVYVDGQRMDTDDLALRAMNAWLNDAGIGTCDTASDCTWNDARIGVGASSAGVRFVDLAFGDAYPVLEVTPSQTDAHPHGTACEKWMGAEVRLCNEYDIYSSFMLWLHLARANDDRFNRRLIDRVNPFAVIFPVACQ